jgi:RNA polymerase sigma factor (sigma-70 family)
VLRLVHGQRRGGDAPEARQARDDLAELARRTVARDPAAIRALIEAVGPAMCRAASGVLGPDASDLDDVVQEALEGLLAALPSFRHQCSVLHFACRVAVLSALATRRRAGVRARWTLEAAAVDEWPGPDQPSPADAALAARRRAVLGMLLDELPPAQAEVLVLHTALGFTVSEIAASLGRPHETVRSRLRLAKQALRDRILANRELAEALETRS